MNFIRGIEPLRAMKIGIITWNNISVGCRIETKKWWSLDFVRFPDGSLRFVSDGAKPTYCIPINSIRTINKIERKRSTIRIECQNENGVEITIEGSIERFRKYFDIIQER